MNIGLKNLIGTGNKEHLQSRYYRDSTKSSFDILDESCKKVTGIMLNMLKDIENNCCVTGWDGYNAVIVSIERLSQAKKFIQAISKIDDILNVVPDISAASTGEIVFEWLEDEGAYGDLVVIINSSGKLVMAGETLDGVIKQESKLKYNRAIPSHMKATIAITSKSTTND